jgi:peptide/nickel transport system substrate-binding protein
VRALRNVRLACGAALCALLIVHATGARGDTTRHPWTQPGHLRIGVLRTIDNLNPLLSGSAAVTDLAQFLFSGLIRFNDHGEAIPDAAEVVPTRENGGISADGLTITYHLRPGVRFSDGTPLTSADVVFTFQQILNPRNNVPFHRPYDLAKSVVAPDPRTIVVHLKAPTASFVSGFFLCGVQGGILPKHLLAGKADLNTDPYNVKPIGSGPFMVEHYETNTTLEMVPNPYWFGGKPGLAHITYRIIPSENTLLIGLRTHDIDFYYSAPEQQYRELRSLEGIATSAKPSSSFEMVAFNTRRAPFSDPRLRQAVARGIDWQGLARTVYLNVDLPDWGDIFPLYWAYTQQPDRNGYDPAAARAMLTAAGWLPGPDGIRERNGVRLQVELRTVAGVIVRENAEVLIQQQLRAIGVDVLVHNASANLMFAPYGAGGLLASGKFDLGIYAWTQNPDPDDSETIGPGSVPPLGGNYSGLADAEIGRLQAAANATYDRSERRALYAKLERRIGELVPFHTIVWRAYIDGWNDDLHGVRQASSLSDFWNVGSWTI